MRRSSTRCLGFDRAFTSANGGSFAPPASAIMIADVVAAVYAFGAIQTALAAPRARGRRRRTIDAALLEAMLSLVAIQIQEAQAAGARSRRRSSGPRVRATAS
jgi:crotonobetainyl-CoA:carnitine CoA-transferase CaiB-like acyl-CoA transferase